MYLKELGKRLGESVQHQFDLKPELIRLELMPIPDRERRLTDVYPQKPGY